MESQRTLYNGRSNTRNVSIAVMAVLAANSLLSLRLAWTGRCNVIYVLIRVVMWANSDISETYRM
jgi:hypothetical protein